MKRILIFALALTFLYAGPALANDKVHTMGTVPYYEICPEAGTVDDDDKSVVSKEYVDSQPVIINARIDDVSTSQSDWVVMPYAGTITKIYSVISANSLSGGDAVLTFEIAGTAITGGTITIASGSAAGTVDSNTPTALNTVTAGQALELITDGGSTGTSPAELTIILDKSG